MDKNTADISLKGLAALPKELLDKILVNLDSRTCLSFLCTCKAIHDKCNLTLFRIKPLDLHYCEGHSYNYRNQYHLFSTKKVIEYMQNNPDSFSNVRALQIRDKTAEYQHLNYNENSHKLVKKIPINHKENLCKSVSMTLTNSLGNFVGLRYLKLSTSSTKFFFSLVENLPPNLKGLSIDIMPKNISFYKTSPKIPQVQIQTLKALSINCISKRALTYRPVRTRNIIRLPSNIPIQDNAIWNIMQLKHKNNISNKRHLKKCSYIRDIGKTFASILEKNSETLQSIAITGMDAFSIFTNENTCVTYSSLKIIKLCAISIPKLSWWLPDLEEKNTALKVTSRELTNARLPAAVAIFSQLFKPVGNGRAEDGECLLRFFGDNGTHWCNLTKEGKDFWANYYYV